METAAAKLVDQLAATLRSHLSRPLHLDADAVGFLAATHGNAAPGDLRTLLADTDASETETLLELLVFPDIQLQLHLERLLSKFQSQSVAQKLLRENLSQPPISLSFESDPADKTGGGDEILRIPLPEDFLERFLTRLNLTRCWPATLADALDAHLQADDCLRARVMLRNGPPSMGAVSAGLCADLVKALSPRHRDFWSALEMVIQLAPELDSGGDPFQLLTARKQRAFQMVEQQRDFEHRLQHSNFEILMGQGQRAPTLAQAEARKQMRVIDAVCQSVFGRTTYFQPAAFG
jgi:hypothetical protein